MKIRVKTNEIDFKVINRISGFRLEDLGFIYILYIYTFLVCLSNCLCPINVKTVKLIGTKFCVGPHMTPGKVYGWSKLKISLQLLQLSSNFIKLKNSRNFFYEINELLNNEKMFTIEREDGREALWKPSFLNSKYNSFTGFWCIFAIKGTVNVIITDPSSLEWHVRFTPLPFNLWLIKDDKNACLAAVL